jgi:hypothetical protein
MFGKSSLYIRWMLGLRIFVAKLMETLRVRISIFLECWHRALRNNSTEKTMTGQNRKNPYDL